MRKITIINGLLVLSAATAAAGVAVGPRPASSYADAEVTRRGVDASVKSVSVERVEHGFRVRLL